MNVIFKRISLVLSCLYMLIGCATSQKSDLSDQRTIYKIEDWYGTYQGTMFMYSSMRADSPILVTLKMEIAPTEDKKRWIWRTTFDNEALGKMVKDYTLVKPDSLAAPFYWLDEGGGTLIHMTYFDDTFYSNFAIAGQYIQSVHKLYKNKMFYEVILQPKTVTYEQHFSYNEEEFHLECYPTTSVQRAVLTKTK